MTTEMSEGQVQIGVRQRNVSLSGRGLSRPGARHEQIGVIDPHPVLLTAVTPRVRNGRWFSIREVLRVYVA